MLSHELAAAIQRDRERDIHRALTTRMQLGRRPQAARRERPISQAPVPRVGPVRGTQSHAIR
jgi:hypothetical protein